jgi:hypothetical protein
MTIGSGLSATSFSNSGLGVTAGTTATLYQRNATSVLGATASSAIALGDLISNSTQLDVTGQVTGQNDTDYYQFNLQGNSPLKADFENLTSTSDLRVQLYNSSGALIADSAGTTAQQTAYYELTSPNGLTANAGSYTMAVTYAPTSPKSVPQDYSLSLYSGHTFQSAYETTAAPQTSASQNVPVDNTLTFATSDAQLYTAQQYHKIDETAETGINVGWLYDDKTALQVQSQVTTADQNDYYNFTFEQGSALKLAFNNQTNTSDLRVQLMDATGTDIIADSDGTPAQQAAYAALTSSSGLNAQPGQYSVKVTYAQAASTANPQTYQFSLYSGQSYSTLDQTTASAETYGHAVLAGDLGTGSYNATNAAATYLYNQAQGTTVDPLQVLEELGPSVGTNLSGILSV